MPKKTTYTAVDPSGQCHIRTTARAYAYAVFYQKSRAEAEARALGAETENRRSYRYLTKVAAGHDLYPARCWLPGISTARLRHADAQAEVSGLTENEYVAKKLAEEMARIDATDWSVWHCAGWCSRHDLAVKLARACCATGGKIVPATKS